jgi:hypothetical protein
MTTIAPSRRWFQFSLGTLFVLMTVLAIWLAWELMFIRERQAWLRRYPLLVDSEMLRSIPPRTSRIPWWRTLLSDEPVPLIAELDIWDDNDRKYVAELFPEAEIVSLLDKGANATFEAIIVPAPNVGISTANDSFDGIVVPAPSVRKRPASGLK